MMTNNEPEGQIFISHPHTNIEALPGVLWNKGKKGIYFSGTGE